MGPDLNAVHEGPGHAGVCAVAVMHQPGQPDPAGCGVWQPLSGVWQPFGSFQRAAAGDQPDWSAMWVTLTCSLVILIASAQSIIHSMPGEGIQCWLGIGVQHY